MANKQPESYRVTTDSAGTITQVEVLVEGTWLVGEKADASDVAGIDSGDIYSVSGDGPCPGCTCWYWDGVAWRYYCC